MAVSNSGMTLYTNNNTQQSWSGSDDLDSEVSHDGGGSESWLVSKNGNETTTLSLSANMGTSKYVTLWMKSDWGAFYTEIFARLSDGTNTTNFSMATGGKHGTPNLAPEISGDFKPSVLQISEGDNASYNQANHSTLAVNVDASSTGNIRSITNHWIDGMWYGDGRVIGGTTTLNTLFKESDELDTSSTNYDGCSKLFDSGLSFYTDVEISTTLGNSYGEVVTWFGKVTTDSLFTLNITGTADFQNTSIVGNSATIALDTTGATSFDMSGGGITNGGTIKFATGQTINGSVLTSCDEVDTNGATLTNVTINNTTSVSGALVGNTSAEIALMSNITFNNYTGKYAIYIPATVTGTITLSGFIGDSSGTDIYWAGTAGTLIVNKSNGTNFTTSASAGGTVSIVASVSININVKDENEDNISGALVYVDDDIAVVGSIINTTTDVSGNVSTSYSGIATTAKIRVRLYGYKFNISTISLVTDSNTNITLNSDPQQQ